MKSFFYFFSAVLLLSSCNNDKQKAQQIFNDATGYYDSGQLNTAKIYIDSLKSTYPKEFDLIKQSIKLMWKIELKENQQTYNYTDSLLRIQTHIADSLKDSFDFVKSEYEDKGTFVYKGMGVEKNVERSYLRSGVYENGDIYLSSVYFGKGNINHTGVKLDIPDSGQSVSTSEIPYDGGTNYRFNDGGNSSEIVTYKRGKDNGAIAFIADNIDKKIKVTYTGGKNYVTYIDKTAQKSIAKSFELAMILFDIHRLRQENDIAEGKINYLQRKLRE